MLCELGLEGHYSEYLKHNKQLLRVINGTTNVGLASFVQRLLGCTIHLLTCTLASMGWPPSMTASGE